MRLSLFVVDFHLEESALGQGDVERLPQLPALEELLRRGRPLAAHPDWRAALLSGIGLSATPMPAPARVAAAMLGLAPQAQPWLAQPVHRIAGLNSVTLHPAGLLRLSAAEAADWSADFNRDFAGTGLQLHALPPGLLLAGMAPGARGAPDPARYLGSALPGAIVPAGEDTPADKALRRVSAEIEMWLHGHPRNLQRERRGELAVNGLWLWGGAGGDLSAEGRVELPRAFGSDPFLRGVWHSRGAVTAEAARLPDLPAVPAAVVVLSAAMQSSRDVPLQRIEEAWFEPLRAALARRAVQPLRLWFGGRGWEIGASAGLSRIWRRRRPWWQQVAA